MSSTLPKRPATSPPTSQFPLPSRARTDPSAFSQPIHSLPLPRLPPFPPPIPPFQLPTPLLSFSMSAPSSHLGRRTQSFDDSGCQHYVDPPLGSDLGRGFEKVRWRVEGNKEEGGLNPGVDGLVKGLREWEESGGVKVGEGGREGIVTWRGIITKFLVAPYEDREGWELNAMAVNGNLYLEQHQSAPKRSYPNEKLFSYYGYAFESYCTTPVHPPSSSQPPQSPSLSTSPSQPTSPSPPHPPQAKDIQVDTNDEWCIVVKTSLAGVRLIMGGEVDCVAGRYDGTSMKNTVELKTNVVIRNERDEVNFERKLLKHWAQSFLLGIPRITIGFRSPSPPSHAPQTAPPITLQSIQHFDTLSIPRLVRGKPHGWEPGGCLSWAGEALAFLRRTIVPSSSLEGGVADGVKEGGRKPVVWRVRFDPTRKVLECWVLGGEEVKEVEGGRGDEDRWGFLPGWMGDPETALGPKPQ